MRIIGLAGRKRSGKDTVGKYLCEKYGFISDSFARPLKDSIQLIYGWNADHTDGDLKEAICPYWRVTPRHVMQQMGTEVGRTLDQNIWRKSLERRLMRRMETENLVGVAITDVRFPNEAHGIRALGGEIWRVIRPSLGPQTDFHASETGLDGHEVDREIENDGTLDDLYARVDVLLAPQFDQTR